MDDHPYYLGYTSATQYISGRSSFYSKCTYR